MNSDKVGIKFRWLPASNETPGNILRSSLKSSAMFGNLQKFSEMFGNVRVTFGQVLENLQKFLESGRKSLENRQMPLEHKIHIFS